MVGEFRLFPESASSIAEQVDNLYFFLLAITCVFSLLILVAIVSFCTYYRRGSNVDRELDPGASYWILEMAWSLIPLALVLVIFGWGAELYYRIATPPDDAMTIDVVGKQWMWKIQHPNGRREINTLHVPVNTRVRLRMISEDVIHSFYAPSFRVKQDVLPGRYTTVWFEPTRLGTYHLFCAEYCGTSHSEMRGEVRVVSQADYAAWARRTPAPVPEVTGRTLFQQYRCHTCHDGGFQRGPSLVGIADAEIPLADGRTVVADDNYLRESILDPAAKVVAGFEPLMPTYRGQISEEEILALINYIRSLETVETDVHFPDQRTERAAEQP